MEIVGEASELCVDCKIRALNEPFSVLFAVGALRRIGHYAGDELAGMTDEEVVARAQISSLSPQEAAAAIACARRIQLGECQF